MKAAYQIADRKDSRALAQFVSGEGQALLPMLELVEQAEMAVDELIDVAGRATIEAVLTLSAREVGGTWSMARWYSTTCPELLHRPALRSSALSAVY